MRWTLSAGACLASALVGCTQARPLGLFGLASAGTKPGAYRELGPATGTHCSLFEIDYAEAVEDALRRHPPANALVDARFTLQHRLGTCTHVEGTAVVVP